MDRIPIYKIINPYLLKIINTNYINRYITLDIIDFFYYFYNKHYNSINNNIIKYIQNQFKQNNSYLECITININDLFKDTGKELSEIEELKVNEYISNYENELLRIHKIYNFFKNNYDFSDIRKYKTTHLSDKIKIKQKSIKSYCNIQEFIKPMKKYITKKYNFNNNKKISENNYAILFILDRINKLFNDYIISLNYGIDLLINEPYFIKYDNNHFLPDIHIKNFKIDNNIIYIKHLDLITNINIINNTDKIINNNGYIKIYNTKNDNRINIYFE
jgi:hypothetical protein